LNTGPAASALRLNGERQHQPDIRDRESIREASLDAYGGDVKGAENIYLTTHELLPGCGAPEKMARG